MKLKSRLSILTASLTTTFSTAAAHSGENRGMNTGMMWSEGGGWIQGGAHMMGYNMWGMGWFGLIPGLIFWAIVILVVIYLYQKVTEKEGEE